MAIDQAIRDHQTWLGYLQPDGLVVSPAALVDSQVLLDRNTAPLQQKFFEYISEVERNEETIWTVRDFSDLLRGFLGWPEEYLVGINGTGPIPETLKVPLREFGETLEPTAAFRNPNATDQDQPWLLLVQEFSLGTDLDAPVESAMTGWTASHTRRFERLLRETQVPIGLIFNGTHFRLVYAPRGENVGTLTFPVSAMAEVAGRSILAAFEMLLSEYRLLAAPLDARLPALLKRSRDYQTRVSTALAAQVLDALYELLRGFQVANDHERGELLRQALARNPDEIYAGLLTVLMRLVFLFFAEDRGLMPGSDLYVRNYSIHGLFTRLRADAEQYPDTMDHRYGAWAQLAALFRVVFTGCSYPHLAIPARLGHLFDSEKYLFLEGQTLGEKRLPLVSDGVVFRVLHKLIVLDGERLSYRTLDVEQIGSVYETMMGFRLEMTSGRTIALKPAKVHGAPVPLNLEQMLAVAPKDRARWIAERTDYKLPAAMAEAVRSAGTIDELLAALERRIARNATPQPLAAGAMILMPTDERRKSGSHYTPRSLTEPIVRKALEPILKQLGENPVPDDILNLKVCDPAMGSGAFLVEACRQLADELVKSWAFHGYKPLIPPDEDEVLFARRLIAQRCLYGVDKNPMAVDLAKLSLWLATLARDHPFTFIDHVLRCGDSLVGLSRKQIISFHWKPSPQMTFLEANLRERMERVAGFRRQILTAGDDMPPAIKRQKLLSADEALEPLRLAGDLAVAAFFSADKSKEREANRNALMQHLENWTQRPGDLEAWRLITGALDGLRKGDKPVKPFHWEIEFPEVFSGDKPGFDAIIGNPPFAGRTTLYISNAECYIDWLQFIHEESHGNSDLVAHFFRRSFNLLRDGGTFGLIATNTIGQGDTRSTGLRYICNHNGVIYHARRRYKWPGKAAVVVSIVHVEKIYCDQKGATFETYLLDGREVPIITAYLFHDGTNEDPERLAANCLKSFQGCVVVGMGFTFDDTDTKGIASPISLMHDLIEKNSFNADAISPYIGGEELYNEPALRHHRFIINFGDIDESEARTKWPELMHIVEERVKPERLAALKSWSPDKAKRAERWWQFSRSAKDMYDAIRGLERVLVISRVGNAYGFAFLPTHSVFSERLVVFPFSSYSSFTVLQSRVHEIWARFFSSTLKDDLMYAPSDCFETFPFPDNFQTDTVLEEAGKAYYEFRADVMVQNNEGLTKTYNRFHDPGESAPDILKLRELHAAMDRAVLDAYGWADIQPNCEFILDYEEEDEEENGRSRGRKKPWRYRWPDDIRDEVLARLLKLNAERAAEERRTGIAAEGKQGSGRARRAREKNSVPDDSAIELDLNEQGNEDE